MKSVARLVSGCFQSVVDNGRNHAVVFDLPDAKGGEDVGATALEAAVMALSGCISTIWAVVAKNSKISYRKVRVEVEADKGDSDPTVTAARATFRVDSDESQERLERTLDKVMRTCPVGLLWEKAGVEIATTVIKQEL